MYIPVVGDVVAVPSQGNGKVFVIEEIRPDGRVSGPAVSVCRSGNGHEVLEAADGVYFHGFEARLLEFFGKATSLKGENS